MEWNEVAPLSLTLQTVGVEKVLAFFVTFHPALGAPHSLACNAPQQALTLVTVGRGGGCPHLEVVGGCARDGVD